MSFKEEDPMSDDPQPDAKPREKLFLIDTSDEDAPSGTGRKRKRSQHTSGRVTQESGVKKEEGVKKEDEDVVMLSSPDVKRIGKPATSKPTQKPTREPTKAKSKARLPTFERGLIGTCYCSAWSLTKGKGYCTPGSTIVIERPKTREEREAERAAKTSSLGAGKAGTTVIKNGKIVKSTTAAAKSSKTPTTGKAQATSANNPNDTIIRFANARGFEIGRLPTALAKHLAPLLAADLIHLAGTVVDCPAALTVGCDIVLEVWVYLTKKAFVAQERREDAESEKATWGKEGETSVQRELRMRKDALARLFERVALRPVKRSALTRSQKTALAPNGAGRAKAGSKASSPAEVIDIDDSSDDEPRATNGKPKPNGKPAPSAKGKERAVEAPKLVKKEGMLDEEDELESGDEAEVLDEKQLHDLESIFNRCVRSLHGFVGILMDCEIERSSRAGYLQRWNRQRRSCTRSGRIKNRRSGTLVSPISRHVAD